jgi:hypothetical protein
VEKGHGGFEEEVLIQAEEGFTLTSPSSQVKRVLEARVQARELEEQQWMLKRPQRTVNSQASSID